MNVLEVGPGNGNYTLAAARALGPVGKLVTIDIEPKMIDRVNQRILEKGIMNIEARVADVFDLPFEDELFDLFYLIAVIGEIPTPERAMEEFHRVLKPDGILSFSELLMDPDYPLMGNLIKLAEPAGFDINQKSGTFSSYTVTFSKRN